MARSTLDPDNVPPRRRRKTPGEVDLRDEIAKAAYYRAEKRGFAPGYEEQDWKAAEAEVRARRSKGR
jgi:hypothetical protein